MSTPIHVLLKADPCLKYNVADGPWCAYNLSRYLSCSFFLETAGSMDHQHVLRQAVFVKEVLATAVALFWQTSRVPSGR